MISTHPHGTIVYRPQFEADTQARLGAGLHEDNDHAIALAGYVTHSDFPRKTFLPGLLKSYRQSGFACLDKVRGAFVLAIRDADGIHIARDGAGVRTVYHGTFAGRFFFAVEPRGILAIPGFPRCLRPGAVAQYLTFSFIPGAQTMLADVFELPAGHVVSANGSQAPQSQRYFYFEDDAPVPRSEAEWQEQFESEFQRAVRERIPDDEPIGLFLSGGIDSSVVAAELAKQSDRPIKTYAIHFGPNYAHELDFARAVAERCGTDHEEVLIQPRHFLPRLQQMIWHLGEPIGDPITMPNFELSAHAAQDVRRVFNGEGGDPLFGGPKNIEMLLHHWYGGVERDPFFREKMYLVSYHRAYDELERLLTPEWRASYDSEAELEGVLTPFFNANPPGLLLNKLMAINIRLKGAHLILPKVERMTAAAGLVPLSPLFDERLIRLSFQMPPTLKVANGIEKIVLKRAYRHDLPAEVINRPKSGMRVPVHFWFQKEMKRYARKILSPRRLKQAGIFNPERVKQLLDYNIEEGPGRYGLRLWMLLTFEMWRNQVIERTEP